MTHEREQTVSIQPTYKRQHNIIGEILWVLSFNQNPSTHTYRDRQLDKLESRKGNTQYNNIYIYIIYYWYRGQLGKGKHITNIHLFNREHFYSGVD